MFILFEKLGVVIEEEEVFIIGFEYLFKIFSLILDRWVVEGEL